MIEKYILYELVTGRILSAGSSYMPELLATEGLAVLKKEIPHDPGDCYVANGEITAKGLPPSEFHVFNYSTKQWVDPRTTETEWPLVRKKREVLLAESDWTQLPDVSIATKEAWAAYRQALRDITDQSDPFNIVWPVRPDRQS